MGRSLLRRLIQEEIRAAIGEMKTHDAMSSVGIPHVRMTTDYKYHRDFDPFSDDIMQHLVDGLRPYLESGEKRSLSDIRKFVWRNRLYLGPRQNEYEAIDIASKILSAEYSDLPVSDK